MVQFLLVGLVLIVVISGITSFLAGRAAEEEALAEAQDTNEVLARSVAKPAVERGLVEGDSGAADRFNRRIIKRLLIEDRLVRVNIWTRDGLLIYTNAYPLILDTFELSDDQREVLAGGGTGYELVDPADPENVIADPGDDPAVGEGDLVRIYTRFRSDAGAPLLFEGYYTLAEIESRRSEIFGSFRWITISGPLLLMLLFAPLLQALTTRITSGAKDRERLLKAAIDASDAERRRIARDLHDGVVQDLAGTAFSVSAVARDPHTPDESRAHLSEAGSSLRDSLKALRSLLAEIHPPELHAVGLPAALDDLIAPAATAGVHASVSVEGVEPASDAVTALVWRVAQEAVRNALRHAEASTLAVTVRGEAGRLVLEVVDDGIGFDQEAPRDPSSFGLRGLRGLVAEFNGTLEVRSSPGEGTTVHMEVDAQ